MLSIFQNVIFQSKWNCVCDDGYLDINDLLQTFFVLLHCSAIKHFTTSIAFKTRKTY